MKRHPLTILSALPFAGFGAPLTLLLFHVDLSIYGFAGIIMLVGLVKKNGIMMTTMAALTGTLPIAIGFGAGSESRRPLGMAVVGGLLFSQTVTLFVTPVFYPYIEKLRRHKTGSVSVPVLTAQQGVA